MPASRENCASDSPFRAPRVSAATQSARARGPLVSFGAASRLPAAPAPVEESAAAEEQDHDDDDEECVGVHLPSDTGRMRPMPSVQL